MDISNLRIGQNATVQAVGGSGALRRHFLDMGLIPGTEVRMVGAAPLGDPVKILVQGYSLTLRKDEARNIQVSENVPPGNAASVPGPLSETGYNPNDHEEDPHPGLGEEGKYHTPDSGRPLPKDTVLTFALAGQQNCGKTTMFNVLTGANQHVGNFPGVTVERKDGQIKRFPGTIVTDIPGIYSLSPYTVEEAVARRFILEEKPTCIINIVDASNIERHLYLTVQLMELGIPMVLALNMMDEVRGNGGSIRVNEMERILGIPVVPISAADNEGVDEVVRHAIHVARYQEVPLRQDFCSPLDNKGALHRCLHSIMHLIEDHSTAAGIPTRFAADKIVEGDESIINALQLSAEDVDAIEHIISQMEKERGLDRAAAIADMRFSFIHKLCAKTVVKPRESREYRRSRRIDSVLTGRWTALPIFIAIMALILWVSIDVAGTPLQEMLWSWIKRVSAVCVAGMERANVSPAIQSLVSEAIFSGVGAVISFVPIIILLFFFLSLLEDSGYMARVAYVTDKILRKAGLSGRSIVPLLIGFGCSVPAVMSARTLPSDKDRKRTIMLTPFISCSAKIPIYAFLSNMFFPGHGGLILVCLYLTGIFCGICSALLRKWTTRHSEPAPFVMELPNYRLPRLTNVGHLLWDKTKDFIQRAFTVIFLATIIIWLLQTFDFRFNMTVNGEGSMLAVLSGWIAPLFNPIGLGDWRIVTALISGFLAKESVVSTMEVLGATQLLTTVSSLSMLVFCLLYTPCIAAIAAVRRELGWKWAAIMVVFQCAVAWIAAFAVYHLAMVTAI